MQPFASVARTVKLAGVVLVGVPDNKPLEESVMPTGGEPAIRLYVYAGVPPVVVNCWLYGVFTSARGNGSGPSVNDWQTMTEKKYRFSPKHPLLAVNLAEKL